MSRETAARPDFGRRGPGLPPVRARIVSMAFVMALVVGALMLLQWQERRAQPRPDVVVEVRGDVPAPGFHPVPEPARVHAALAAAGVTELQGFVDAELPPGTRVVLEGGRLRLETMDEQLVFGLPLDVNAASAEALDALPGVGPGLAAAIVAEREAAGPFEALEALVRVKGIGPATVEQLRPFVVAEQRHR